MSYYATQEAESIQSSYKNEMQCRKTSEVCKVVMILEVDIN